MTVKENDGTVKKNDASDKINGENIWTNNATVGVMSPKVCVHAEKWWVTFQLESS